MKTDALRTRSRARRGILLVVGVTAALVLAGSSPALAHKRHHRHHQPHRAKRNHSYVPHHRPAPLPVHVRKTFVVPHRIPAAAARTYAPYFRGDTYYRPHRHHHRVYRFPVRTRYGVAYEARHYCDGRAFVEPAFHGRVALGGPHFRVSFHY